MDLLLINAGTARVIDCKYDESISDFPPTEVLETGGFSVEITDAHTIEIRNSNDFEEIFLKQMEYGSLIDIKLLDSGEIFAHGQGNSYIMSVSVDDNVLGVRHSELPVRYAEKCNQLWIFLAACRPAIPSFSSVIAAVFYSGYDENGEFQSEIFGIGETTIDLSFEDYNSYMWDSASGVVLNGQAGRALFDGVSDPIPCPQK